jgi:hypothetical protein
MSKEQQKGDIINVMSAEQHSRCNSTRSRRYLVNTCRYRWFSRAIGPMQILTYNWSTRFPELLPWMSRGTIHRQSKSLVTCRPALKTRLLNVLGHLNQFSTHNHSQVMTGTSSLRYKKSCKWRLPQSTSYQPLQHSSTRKGSRTPASEKVKLDVQSAYSHVDAISPQKKQSSEGKSFSPR